MGREIADARISAAAALVLEAVLRAVREGKEWTWEHTSGALLDSDVDPKTGQQYVGQVQGLEVITIRIFPKEESQAGTLRLTR